MTKVSLFLAIGMLFCSGIFVPVQVIAGPGEDAVEMDMAVHGPKVIVVPGGLKFEVTGDIAEAFYVYSITGQLVKTVTLACGSESVGLPQGCYVIKCSHWSRKVVVR